MYLTLTVYELQQRQQTTLTRIYNPRHGRITEAELANQGMAPHSLSPRNLPTLFIRYIMSYNVNILNENIQILITLQVNESCTSYSKHVS